MNEPSTAEDTWSEEPPGAPGLYWFFGELEWGSMGGHYTGAVPFAPRLCLVEVAAAGGGLLATSAGRFVVLRKFDPADRGTGWWGKWVPATHPETPYVEPPELSKN